MTVRGHAEPTALNLRINQPRRPTIPVTIIEPASGWIPFKLGEFWAYRELLYFLVWANLKVQYKQTVLGAAWAIIQPLFTMIVFSIFFGRLAGVPSGDLPYPVFVYAALVPWTYFANVVSISSNVLVQHQGVITKVYFPRAIMPFASVVGGLLDFTIALSVLGVLMLIYGVTPSVAILAVPLLVAMALLTAAGVALWLSALNVRYRDVRFIIPFLIQVWLFATPVAYPSSLVPERWRALYGLNPMTGVVDSFRWALLDQPAPSFGLFGVSILVVLLVLGSGMVYFSRAEKTFADVV
jgi:lipopolysaccharide transport system permease protein